MPDTRTKPAWPYPNETKLTAAPNGQWCKKHRGKTYYFGVWADPGSALRKWRQDWPLITSGKNPAQIVTNSCRVGPALSNYVASRMRDRDQGDIEDVSFREIREYCKRLIRILGRTIEVKDLSPADFERVLFDIAGLKPISRRKFIMKTRQAFRWVEKQYSVTVNYGPDFKPPPKKAIRRQINERQDKSLEADIIRAMIQTAYPKMKALVLLGINGGFGNKDVASLPVDAIDLDGAVIDFYRHKTEARRIVPLWPETVAALREIPPVEGTKTFFATKAGKPLVGNGQDHISRMMGDLSEACGVEATFYCFRYTFATIAAEIPDDHARKLIMGHVIDGVSEGYIQRFPRERLLSLTDRVHDWLYS